MGRQVAQTIRIKCDNLAVVIVLNKGGTKDAMLAMLARNRWLEMASNDFVLEVEHIEGKANCVADLLSRWDQNVNSMQELAYLVPDHVWCVVKEAALLINDCI